MDGKMNKDIEEVYERLGIFMPYKVMCKYYSGEMLYKRMLIDIVMKKWKTKTKVEIEKVIKSNNVLDDSNGKVYKIVSDKCDRIYIGSTIFEIEDRLRKHTLDYEFYKKRSYHYCSSYEILKSGSCSVMLLEEQINKKQLLEKESRYINENLEKCVNVMDPLSKRKLYDNTEENKKRELASNKYMIRLVCDEIKNNNKKIDNMEDMYELYINKINEIKKEKKNLDEEYYSTLIEYYRIRDIDIM